VFNWMLYDELRVSRAVLDTANYTQRVTQASIEQLSGELDQLATQIETGLKQVDQDSKRRLSSCQASWISWQRRLRRG